MSYPALTPNRPVPGTFFQTPAASNINNGPLFQTRTPSAPAAQESTPAPTLQRLSPVAPKIKSETLSTRERAARTVNDTLAQEARYPDLDNYLSRASIVQLFGWKFANCCLQKVFHPTTRFLPTQHGRHSTRSKCTISPTRSSTSTIEHKFRRAWVFSLS